MLELTMRRATDGALVPVNVAALALRVSGEFRFPLEESGTARRTGDCPALIIQCRSRQDALACVDFAASQGIVLAMHNDARNPHCWEHCDHGLAVDLSALR
ncbi:hypothetical protein [Aquisalimonas sp.]|uniref:hypothetical protein n=1 Tax=unclassified Aquisalimonas TaxID=2644645 RepID=UPI0025C032B9|nr:hypothetical protein [Aquisalimonas sp.]